MDPDELVLRVFGEGGCDVGGRQTGPRSRVAIELAERQDKQRVRDRACAE
jgi:hypothetical protein